MAAKDKGKTVYTCGACGAQAPKWAGQCAGCGEWNRMEETVQAARVPAGAARTGYAGAASGVTTLDRVRSGTVRRIPTGNGEFDRVLGGGLAAGGVVVLGGNPGAGKSTLLLQTSCHVARGETVLYVSGEENEEQVADRATRLDQPKDRMLFASATDVTAIERLVEERRPAVVVVDSIQTAFHPDVESEPGNTGQVKTCAAYLTRVAKRTGTSVILVGHINKAESIAGPMALVHIVDAVLMLSSTDDARYRIMRAEKNRFGSTSEIGVFAMTGTGLKEVKNPSAIFLSRSVEDAPGVVVTPLWEGTRPLLVEVQALLDQSAGGNPRRVAVGMDGNRVAMLLAVLNKHGGLAVYDQDVYVNAVGGVRVVETGADLAVLLAAVSSLRDRPIRSDVVAFGEVGLSGEVRPVQNGQDRIREAAKMGFKTAVVPEANAPKERIDGMAVVPVATLQQALDWLKDAA